jgi:hypothetical protein
MTLVKAQVGGRALASAYLHAKRAVIAAGYESEVSWQEEACDAPITERRFLSEAAWVVLNAGMRESVIRRVFPRIAAAFAEFTDAASALVAAQLGRRKALRAFRHHGKITAIVDIIRHVDHVGLPEVRRRLTIEGRSYLETLPYVGPVTAYHLAKNLGLNYAKPDRHLSRLAMATGYSDAHTLCSELREILGESVAVIDVVLWRFATLSRDYLQTFLAVASGATACQPTTMPEVMGPLSLVARQGLERRIGTLGL